jgi:hypothetical protein
VTVDLVMQVSRDDRDRLNGTVRLAVDTDALAFSGTLELMRVLEELVPTDGGAVVTPRFERERP